MNDYIELPGGYTTNAQRSGTFVARRWFTFEAKFIKIFS